MAAAMPQTVYANSPRDVFSHHDPNGRLPNTRIQSLGQMTVQGSRFTAFYLTFVNPVSHHGQHRIAVIRNDTEFVGSFHCWLNEGGASVTFGPDTLIVHQSGTAFAIRFDREGPIERRVFLCGEGSGWENNI